MTEILQSVSGFGPTEILAFFAIFCRIGAACALLPAFGEQAVPARIKLAASLAFSAILAPLLWEQTLNALPGETLTFVIFSETIAGLAIGLFFRLVVVVLQIAGAVAAQSTSLSQIFGAGLGAEPQAAFSTLLVVSGLALAASMGLHVHLIEAFIFSYELFPILKVLDAESLSIWGVSHVARVFSLGFSLAAPFVIASVIYNFGLGVINRAMPQLMVAMVGAPAISLGGLIILCASAPLILSVWMAYFNSSFGLDVPGLR